MIALLQRVSEASVMVDGQIIADIGLGLMVLIGVERGDGEPQAERLLQRVLSYRIFPDNDDKMNLSVADVVGGVLLVPQFTLPADTRKGNRPSFTPAASPQEGAALFDYFVNKAKQSHGKVATGRFGADMKVALVNDGPVTFWLQVPPPS